MTFWKRSSSKDNEPEQQPNAAATEVVEAVETNTNAEDVIAEIHKRFELKQKPDARICDACGIYIQMHYGRFFTDDAGRQVWVCSRKTCNYFGPSTLKDALRLGGGYLLEMPPGKMGPASLHELVTPWYLTGLTKPNRKPYGHINRYAFVAAVDQRYGQQLTGPRNGYAKERHMKETKVRQSRKVFTTIELPEYSKEHPVVIDADVPATYARASWRPLQRHEKDERELDAVIQHAKTKRLRAETRIRNKRAQIERLQNEVEKLTGNG